MSKKRLIIVDDDPDVLIGLEAWLSQDYSLLSFDSGDSFLAALLRACRVDAVPTCFLLDYQMPAMNGVELQSRARELGFDYPTVFMSGNVLQADIIAAWRGGAVDFILKPFSACEISDALQKAFDAASAQLDEPPALNDGDKKSLPISRREAQVLMLLGEGLQQQEIARQLSLSLRTVKMYRTFLKNKLDLNTLVEIGKFCEQNRSVIGQIAGAGESIKVQETHHSMSLRA